MYTQADLFAFDDKEYREEYVGSHVCSSISHQIKLIREDRGLTQADMAMGMGTKQSVISRIESDDYGKLSVQTLLQAANFFDVALVVKFVSFPKFLSEFDDVSLASLNAESYDTTKSQMCDLEASVDKLKVVSTRNSTGWSAYCSPHTPMVVMTAPVANTQIFLGQQIDAGASVFSGYEVTPVAVMIGKGNVDYGI